LGRVLLGKEEAKRCRGLEEGGRRRYLAKAEKKAEVTVVVGAARLVVDIARAVAADIARVPAAEDIVKIVAAVVVVDIIRVAAMDRVRVVVGDTVQGGEGKTAIETLENLALG
jgi:hypothetical protein